MECCLRVLRLIQHARPGLPRESRCGRVHLIYVVPPYTPCPHTMAVPGHSYWQAFWRLLEEEEDEEKNTT